MIQTNKSETRMWRKNAYNLDLELPTNPKGSPSTYSSWRTFQKKKGRVNFALEWLIIVIL